MPQKTTRRPRVSTGVYVGQNGLVSAVAVFSTHYWSKLDPTADAIVLGAVSAIVMSVGSIFSMKLRDWTMPRASTIAFMLLVLSTGCVSKQSFVILDPETQKPTARAENKGVGRSCSYLKVTIDKTTGDLSAEQLTAADGVSKIAGLTIFSNLTEAVKSLAHASAAFLTSGQVGTATAPDPTEAVGSIMGACDGLYQTSDEEEVPDS